jgi:DNA-binding PadR family transcriptional regulator
VEYCEIVVPKKPFVKVDSEQPKLNATAASLLGFLASGPQSGYELAALIEESIGNFWNVTRSQIYRELRMLEEAGFVNVGTVGVRERRPFDLTKAGKKAFDAWIARDPGEENTRFPLLLMLFFGDRLPAKDLARILRSHRARHEERLAGYRAYEREVELKYPFPAKTIRFGRMYEEMVLAWFETLKKDGLL